MFTFHIRAFANTNKSTHVNINSYIYVNTNNHTDLDANWDTNSFADTNSSPDAYPGNNVLWLVKGCKWFRCLCR